MKVLSNDKKIRIEMSQNEAEALFCYFQIAILTPSMIRDKEIQKWIRVKETLQSYLDRHIEFPGDL